MVARVDIRRLKGVHANTPPDERIHSLIRAFRRAVSDAGVIHEWKKHEYYEKPSDKKRRIARQRVREAQKALNTTGKKHKHKGKR